MHGMEYITEETVNKLQKTIKNKPYICNDSLENEVIKAMLDILHDDTKFQELQKQIMDKIILGEI
jgi:hypothetical protein